MNPFYAKFRRCYNRLMASINPRISRSFLLFLPPGTRLGEACLKLLCTDVRQRQCVPTLYDRKHVVRGAVGEVGLRLDGAGQLEHLAVSSAGSRGQAPPDHPFNPIRGGLAGGMASSSKTSSPNFAVNFA